jgi:hypothetical protein
MARSPGNFCLDSKQIWNQEGESWEKVSAQAENHDCTAASGLNALSSKTWQPPRGNIALKWPACQ